MYCSLPLMTLYSSPGWPTNRVLLLHTENLYLFISKWTRLSYVSHDLTDTHISSRKFASRQSAYVTYFSSQQKLHRVTFYFACLTMLSYFKKAYSLSLRHDNGCPNLYSHRVLTTDHGLRTLLSALLRSVRSCWQNILMGILGVILMFWKVSAVQPWWRVVRGSH
jgi:hypothetical protein